MGDQVKGRSMQELKSLAEVPNVVHMKELVLRCNLCLISPPDRVIKLSSPIQYDIVSQVNAIPPKKLKNFIDVP